MRRSLALAGAPPTTSETTRTTTAMIPTAASATRGRAVRTHDDGGVVGADRIDEWPGLFETNVRATLTPRVRGLSSRDPDEPSLHRAGAAIAARGPERREERLGDEVLGIGRVAAARKQVSVEVVDVEAIQRGETGGLRRGLAQERRVVGHAEAERLGTAHTFTIFCHNVVSRAVPVTRLAKR